MSPYFSFGHLQTTWIVGDGDGTEEYKQENIRTHFDLDLTSYQMISQQEENTFKNDKRKTANTDAHFSGTVKDIALIDLSSAAAPQRKISC